MIAAHIVCILVILCLIASINTEVIIWSQKQTLTESFIVQSGDVLQIQKGVEIELHVNAQIIVQGAMTIAGEKDQSVVITPLSNSEHWEYIVFDKANLSNSTIEHLYVGSSFNSTVISLKGPSPGGLYVSNVEIVDGNAFFVKDAALDITESKFTDVTRAVTFTSGSLSLSSSELTHNASSPYLIHLNCQPLALDEVAITLNKIESASLVLKVEQCSTVEFSDNEVKQSPRIIQADDIGCPENTVCDFVVKKNTISDAQENAIIIRIDEKHSGTSVVLEENNLADYTSIINSKVESFIINLRVTKASIRNNHFNRLSRPFGSPGAYWLQLSRVVNIGNRDIVKASSVNIVSNVFGSGASACLKLIGSAEGIYINRNSFYKYNGNDDAIEHRLNPGETFIDARYNYFGTDKIEEILYAVNDFRTSISAYKAVFLLFPALKENGDLIEYKDDPILYNVVVEPSKYYFSLQSILTNEILSDEVLN